MRHDLHQPMAMFTPPGALTQNLLSAHYRLCLGVWRRPSMWLMLRQPNCTIPQHTSPGWSATLCVAPYGHPEGSTWPKVNLTPSQSFPISANNTITHNTSPSPSWKQLKSPLSPSYPWSPQLADCQTLVDWRITKEGLHDSREVLGATHDSLMKNAKECGWITK